MEEVQVHVLDPELGSQSSFTLEERESEGFREMLRQQLLGDQELLRDAMAGREDPEIRLHVYDRIQLVRRLIDEVGGIPVIDRRRVPVSTVKDKEVRVHLPFAALWVVLGIFLSTVAVYATYLLAGHEIVSLYIPWVAFATLRFGRRKGVLTVLGSAVAFMAIPPYAVIPDAEGAVAFAAMLLAIWAIRRDVF